MNRATYYNVQYATALGGPYDFVPNCHGSDEALNYEVPSDSGTKMCRHSGLQTDPPTTYYYKVQACAPGGGCSIYTDTSQAVFNQNYNSPITCNCTPAQIPPMIKNGANYDAPNPIRVATCNTIPNGSDFQCNEMYQYDANQFAALRNTLYDNDIPNQLKLLIMLPGSGSTCGYSRIMYTAQNLGYDAICVNYSNEASQEDVCMYKTDGVAQGHPDCFYWISEAKFDGSGRCGENYNGSTDCGVDPHTNDHYHNKKYDSVYYRALWMLQYLYNGSCTGCGHVPWGQYLTSNQSDLNWGAIVMGGVSQGGDMATYAAGFQNRNGRTPLFRAINFSAPPQATIIYNYQDPQRSGTRTAATYFTDQDGQGKWFNATTIRKVFGFVSANDDHYSNQNYGASVYEAVWTKMGFTQDNYDAEWDMACTASTQYPRCNQTQVQGLNCAGQHPSHSLVTFQNQSPSGGHHDPEQIWNQDAFEFLLSTSIN